MNGYKRESKQVAYDVNSQKRFNPFSITPLQNVEQGSENRDKQNAYPCQPVNKTEWPHKKA
jgi:hypothetical protein